MGSNILTQLLGFKVATNIFFKEPKKEDYKGFYYVN